MIIYTISNITKKKEKDMFIKKKKKKLNMKIFFFYKICIICFSANYFL